MKTLLVILGPTASGKTSLAIDIAKKLKTEIISADSRQFYKEIPIGTAAPDKGQLDEVKHHFVGHLSIKEEFNVSRYEQEVIQLLDKKFQDSKVMILTGGSGLYIDAICKGIDDLPDPDEKIRKDLNNNFEKNSLEGLQEMLKNLDPVYFNIVDKNNPKRLMRAIEVCLQTGKPYSKQRLNKSKERIFEIVKIGLELPREVLYDRINKRTEVMLNQDWLEEAKSVYKYKHLNALNTVGYKELFKHLDGDWDLDFAVVKIKTNTRRYAKRQMTWFKKDAEINWFHPDDRESIFSFINERLID